MGSGRMMSSSSSHMYVPLLSLSLRSSDFGKEVSVVNQFNLQIPSAAFVMTGLIADQTIGWNRHVWDVRPNHITAGSKIAYVSPGILGLKTQMA